MVNKDREYWQNYTGWKNWANPKNLVWANAHQTRLCINYTYYNSPDLMKRIWDWYGKIDPDGQMLDYQVIDDGSQKYPITELDYPKHWKVYRIEEDMGWNNEGARNCLMRATSNRWNLLLDSDWVITVNNLKKIRRAISISWLDEDLIYMPGQFGPKVMRNSFLVSKNNFLDKGGYDQAFIGYHGNDYSFLRADYEYDFSDFFRLSRIVLDVVDPQDKKRIERVKEFHAHLMDLESKGYGVRDEHDKQDFRWTDEEAHKKHWKHIDFIRIN